MRYLTFLVLLFFVACNNNKSHGENKTVGDSSTRDKKQEASSAATPDNGIVGEWKLVGVTEDKNGNAQLDPEERANASGVLIDYMKLNSDGSAVFHEFRTEGRYEIRTNQTSNRNYLDLYDKQNGVYKKGYIMSVSKDELLIMNKFGGDSITIWERL